MDNGTGLLAHTKVQSSTIVDETSLGYMLGLAGPMIVATTSFTLMQFVDRIMVSRLGTAALAAVLPAGFMASIPSACVMGVFASIGTFVSQSLGRGDKRECTSYFWQAVYMGLVFSIAVLAIGWPLAPSIFRAFGHEPEVAALEVIYFRIMLIANTAAVFVWAGSQFFMGIHRPIVTMYAALTAQVVNITVNYILIFGKLGFPRMGIAGAAWGTVVGIVIGGSIRMATFLSGDIRREYANSRMWNIDVRKMRDILKIGLPAGLELALSTGLWGAILFWLVGGLGKEAQAATSAALACTNLSILPIEGIRMALTSAVGKSIGSGRPGTAASQTQVCLRVSVIYMGLIGLCFLIFRRQLMGIWSGDNQVVAIGVKVLIIAAVYQVFYAARTVYSGALRGAGDTVWLAIASALGAVVVLGLGGLALKTALPSLGAIGPWLAAMLSIMVVGSANYFRFRSNRWKHIDLFKRPAVAVTFEDEATVAE